MTSPIQHQPRYYAEDFDPPFPALEIFCGLVIALCALAIGAWMGFEYSAFLHRQAAAAAKYQPRPTVANPPQLIPCSPEGRIEHDRVCRARMRSGKVGQ